jgi:hypothetical protein
MKNKTTQGLGNKNLLFIISKARLTQILKTKKQCQQSYFNTICKLRLQDTLFDVLRKIATARSKSVRSSNFHQMLASACKI